MSGFPTAALSMFASLSCWHLKPYPHGAPENIAELPRGGMGRECLADVTGGSSLAKLLFCSFMRCARGDQQEGGGRSECSGRQGTARRKITGAIVVENSS